jgi:YggT family protein
MSYLINLINIFVQLVTLLVIIKVFLSYFMSPYHPVRMTVDRIINPLLRPIQRIIPSVGMLDLSPLVLIIVVQLIGKILITALVSTIH